MGPWRMRLRLLCPKLREAAFGTINEDGTDADISMQLTWYILIEQSAAASSLNRFVGTTGETTAEEVCRGQ